MPADLATAASPWTVTVPGIGEPDYDAIYAAVVGTAEGRWFLAQFASRNRNTDTAQVLAAIDRLESELGREHIAAPAVPAPMPLPPGPDIARLRRDLGELADALLRARADITAVVEPGKVTERPSILAAAEALQGLAWFMRERGMETRFCDRIDDCADDIHAMCAIPDLTAQRTRTIVDVLGDLENRLHAIRANLDGGADQFGDLRASPAANANPPAAAKHAAVDANKVKAKVVDAKKVDARKVDAGVAAFTLDLVAEIELSASHGDADSAAPACADTMLLAAPLLPALATERSRDDQPAAANSAGTQASPRLSHLLMAAELDRLLDAQAATRTGTSDQPPPEPMAATAPVETTAPVAAAAPGEVITPPEAATQVEAVAQVEAAVPVEVTTPAEAASFETVEIEPAPLEPEVPATPAAPAPRRVAAIAKDLFADVMALSEEERIALFS